VGGRREEVGGTPIIGRPWPLAVVAVVTCGWAAELEE